MRRAGLLGLVLVLVAGPAWAEVTLTFYAHPGARVRDGYLLFPHAFVHATGTLDDTGEAVDWSAGFTARDPGPQLLFVRGVGVVEYPNPRYVGEGKPYLRLTVSDAAYRARCGPGLTGGAVRKGPSTTCADATASVSSPIWPVWRACGPPTSPR